jgi:hypothetical protein
MTQGHCADLWPRVGVEQRKRALFTELPYHDGTVHVALLRDGRDLGGVIVPKHLRSP